MRIKLIFFTFFIFTPIVSFAMSNLDFISSYIYCDSVINPQVYNCYNSNKKHYLPIFRSKLDSLLNDRNNFKADIYCSNQKYHLIDYSIISDTIIINNQHRYFLQDLEKIDITKKKTFFHYSRCYLTAFLGGVLLSGTWEGLDYLFYSHEYHWKTVLGFSSVFSIIVGFNISSSDEGYEIRFK